MRHTCPKCNSTTLTLAGVEEGWDATGPRAVHVTRKSYRCRDCGHEWTDHFKDELNDYRKN